MNESELEREKRRANERAAAYREMMQLWAWKDLQNVIARIKDTANGIVDDMDIRDLSVGIVAESRGVRKAFATLEAEINFILEGIQ